MSLMPPITYVFENVCANGVKQCKLLWNNRGPIHMFAPGEPYDVIYQMDDILAVDLRMLKYHEVTFAMRKSVESAREAVKLIPQRKVKPVNTNPFEEDNTPVGEDEFEDISSILAVEKPLSSIPCIIRSNGLVILKIRFAKKEDLDKVIGVLVTLRFFHWQEHTERSLWSLFLNKTEKRLALPLWRRNELKPILRSGILDGWLNPN